MTNAPQTASATSPVATPVITDVVHLPADLDWLLQPDWVARGENLIISGAYGKTLLTRRIIQALRAAGKSVFNVNMTTDSGPAVTRRFDVLKGSMVTDSSLLEHDLVIIYTMYGEGDAPRDRSGEYLAQRAALGKSTILLVDAYDADCPSIQARFGAQLAEVAWSMVHVMVPTADDE